MKHKREKTKFEKFQDAVKEFFAGYRFGVDFWAIGLFGLLMLPNIVWWCYSPGNDVLRHIAAPPALDVFSYIFQILTLGVLMFVARSDREDQRINFESPFFTFELISLVLYYAAWIFYFCAFVNIAVLLFMAVFPCVALGCFAFLRRNWIALAPLAVFAALHLAWVIDIVAILY